MRFSPELVIIVSMINISNLAKLYPEAKPIGQTDRANSILVEEVENKVPFWHIMIIAILMTVTVVLFILLFNYLNQSVDMNNLADFVSQIIETLLVWVGVSVVVLIGVLLSLRHVNINKFIFLIIYALYAVPTSQLTYDLFYHFNNKIINVIPFSLTLFIEDLIFIFFIIKIMNSKKDI